MLGNYDLLLESSQELQEFLVFIYENEAVIADIDIPFEWKSLIDESYDEDGNQYYSLTNRAIELLIAEGFLDNASKKFGHAVGTVGNAIKGANDFANKGLLKATNAIHNLDHKVDKGIDSTFGKKHKTLAAVAKNIKNLGTGIASHLGAEAITHNPYAAMELHNGVHGAMHAAKFNDNVNKAAKKLSKSNK